MTTPFEDIRALIDGMPAAEQAARDDMRAFIGPSRNVLRSLGRMDEALIWLAGWQGRINLAIERPLIAVFVGAHEVAKEVLQQDPIQGAKNRATLMTSGPAGVRGIASSYGAAFKVFEFGLEYPAADMTKAASLSERDCAAAIAFGMEVVAEGADVLVLGDCGFGSATAAAGIARGLYGGQTEYWAGGRSDVAPRRIAAIDAAAKLHAQSLSDPLDVLRCFGGRDLAGLAGAIIAARHQRIPVILDGFVVCAAAAVLHKLNPNALDHCLAGHVSAEPAHGALLERLELTPLLDLGIGVGDGTGASLAMGALKAAASAATLIFETE